jgi:tetratricopeptide repeat protein 8
MTPSVEAAFQGTRPGTSRPVTSSGRFVRLGTASMRTESGGPFIDANKLDFKKYSQRPHLAKVLADFIIYHDHNPKRALELAALATVVCDYNDWWWKARLGKCYYQLGLLRDAERQFKSALKTQEMVVTFLELGKVYMKLDQPLAAVECYQKGIETYPDDTHLLLAIARVHDVLNDMEKSVVFYKKTLQLDSSNIESIACLASNHFYEDHPEIGLRLYRRLLQMGVNNTELWRRRVECPGSRGVGFHPHPPPLGGPSATAFPAGAALRSLASSHLTITPAFAAPPVFSALRHSAHPLTP